MINYDMCHHRQIQDVFLLFPHLGSPLEVRGQALDQEGQASTERKAMMTSISDKIT